MFYIIALEGCPYSLDAVQLFEQISDSENGSGKPQLKYKVQWVSQNEKEKYKTTVRQTFPQIFYVISHGSSSSSTKANQKLYIGGLKDFEEFMTHVKSLKQQYPTPYIIFPFLTLFKHV